jgi:adenylate cyclase
MVVGSIQAITIGGDFAETFVDVVFTWRVFRLMLTWFAVVIFTLLLLDVSEKYGPGVFWKIVIGKYHKPVTEERIFMFMDLSNSTGLAESLGEERYFHLLRSLYYIVTEPVLNAEGEIYQYVGDEIIISWSIKHGLRNSNCLRCFFNVNEALERQRANLIQQFGVLPSFKAAVHMGRVVAGEIGLIKRDIVYAGDILNSTSRIMNLSRKYGEQLLISDVIYDRLKADRRFQFQFLDALVLRGKTVESKVYGVRMILDAKGEN